MTPSTKYCLTAIICTLIAVAAYITINRYESVGSASGISIQRDNLTGTTRLVAPKF